MTCTCNQYTWQIQGYGITSDEKIEIAETVCEPLLQKIHVDILYVTLVQTSCINLTQGEQLLY